MAVLKTLQIKSICNPPFVAGLVLIDGIAHYNWCAPILHYMSGWSEPKIRNYSAMRGWEITVISEETK